MAAAIKLSPAQLRTLGALVGAGTFAAKSFWSKAAPAFYKFSRSFDHSASIATLKALADKGMLSTHTSDRSGNCMRWTITCAGRAALASARKA
jgi:acyl CoA:acetate/3-ketoacid CoA transferase alpha subunit